MSLLHTLNNTGYVVQHFKSFGEFDVFCKEIGDVKQTTDVKITNGLTSFPYIHDEIPFHTDNPEIEIVGWFCIDQDEIAGESLIIDVRNILLEFSEIEIKRLATITLPTPVSKKNFPILQMKNGHPHIYFINRLWENLAENSSKEDGDIIKKFLCAVTAIKNDGKYLSIRLKK